MRYSHTSAAGVSNRFWQWLREISSANTANYPTNGSHSGCLPSSNTQLMANGRLGFEIAVFRMYYDFMIQMGRTNMMSLIKSSPPKKKIVFVMIIIIIFMRRCRLICSNLLNSRFSVNKIFVRNILRLRTRAYLSRPLISCGTYACSLFSFNVAETSAVLFTTSVSRLSCTRKSAYSPRFPNKNKYVHSRERGRIVFSAPFIICRFWMRTHGTVTSEWQCGR